jgi:ribose transport system substrate-binding protein
MIMMKNKVMAALIVVLGVLLILSGCSSSQGSSGDGSDKPTIGLVTINQEAYFFTETVKAQKAADDLGGELIVNNPNNDAIKQNDAIQNFVNQGVDAIIVNAIDTKGIVPAMEEAARANIPVISVDSVVDSDAVSVQIGVDNAESSKELGDFFNEYAKDNMKEAVKMGVVGALNSTIQVSRQDAFLDTVKQTPDLKVVNIVDGQNVQQKAMSSAENLMIGHPELNALFATGEPALIGLAGAVKSQNKEDSVKIFGWDLSKQVIEGIEEGWVEGVVQQHPDEYGSEAVKAAVKLANKEEVEKNISVPVTIVTKDNVDEFKGLFK